MQGSPSTDAIGALRRELTDRVNQLWADHRDTAQRHADEDDRRFDKVNEKIEELKAAHDNFQGAVNFARWILGLGLAANLGLQVVQLLRPPGH